MSVLLTLFSMGLTFIIFIREAKEQVAHPAFVERLQKHSPEMIYNMSESIAESGLDTNSGGSLCISSIWAPSRKLLHGGSGPPYLLSPCAAAQVTHMVCPPL